MQNIPIEYLLSNDVVRSNYDHRTTIKTTR